jgi:hypothetical protein
VLLLLLTLVLVLAYSSRAFEPTAASFRYIVYYTDVKTDSLYLNPLAVCTIIIIEDLGF